MRSLAHVLISYGADINYLNRQEPFSTTPFVDAWSKRWRNPLEQDVIAQNWDDLFFQNITQFDLFGFSSLQKAYLGLNGLTFDQVLASTKRSDVDECDYQGRTVLSWAAARGDSQTVEKLFACGANPENRYAMQSPLQYAVSVDVSTAEILLDAKADANIANNVGAIPMHYVTSKTSSLIKRMVDLSADIEKRDTSGQTPILYACKRGHVNAVKKLLECGADITVRVVVGRNPILWALVFNCRHVISVLLLSPSLQFEADIGGKSDFFSQVALNSDIQTLVELKDQWPITTRFEETFDVHRALLFALDRRDFNASWSTETALPRDEDPIAWHNVFTEMINTLIERSKQASDSEDDIWEGARE